MHLKALQCVSDGVCSDCDMIAFSKQQVASNLRTGVSKSDVWRHCGHSSWCATPPSVERPFPGTSHKQLKQHSTITTGVRCRAWGPGRPDTATVVEYLHLLEAKPDVDPESMDLLLDSLWSLQYMVPSIMCAAAGPVSNCIVHRQEQGETDSPSAAGRFTHAVHFRLNNRLALENLQKHPLTSQLQEQVNDLCSTSAHIVYEGSVAKRLEALFRRGDEFASGVEHVLLLQPSSEGAVGADMFLGKLAALAESSVAGGIQASYGAVICCAHTAATHVLMTRFAAQQQMQQFLQTPACAAVLQQDPRVPVRAAGSLCMSVQPTEESTKVKGAGSLGI